MRPTAMLTTTRIIGGGYLLMSIKAFKYPNIWCAGHKLPTKIPQKAQGMILRLG